MRSRNRAYAVIVGLAAVTAGTAAHTAAYATPSSPQWLIKFAVLTITLPAYLLNVTDVTAMITLGAAIVFLPTCAAMVVVYEASRLLRLLFRPTTSRPPQSR